MRTLNPTPSERFYCSLISNWKNYNRTARIKGKVKMSFNHWLKNNNLDLSGKTKINNPFL